MGNCFNCKSCVELRKTSNDLNEHINDVNDKIHDEDESLLIINKMPDINFQADNFLHFDVQSNKSTHTRSQYSDLLIFGYTHEQCDYLCISLPLDLINLIKLFHDGYHHWAIGSHNMKLFLKNTAPIPGYNKMYGKPFEIGNMSFEWMLFPNDKFFEDRELGFMCCGVFLGSLPSDIEQMGCYIEINCTNNDRTFKRMITWKTINMATGGALMKSSDCKHLDETYLECFIDIRYIKYKDNSTPIIKPFHMHSNTQFIWKINSDLMEKTKSLIKGERVHSENFDDNSWHLSYRRDHNGNLRVYLICLRLPYNIKSLQAKYKIHLIMNGEDVEMMERVRNFNHSKFANGVSMHKIPFGELLEKLFTLKIELEITKLFDEQDQEINKDNWSQYGIVVE